MVNLRIFQEMHLNKKVINGFIPHLYHYLLPTTVVEVKRTTSKNCCTFWMKNDYWMNCNQVTCNIFLVHNYIACGQN